MKAKVLKKVASFMLCLCMLLSAFPIVNASNSYTINGVTVHWNDFSSSPDECWVYANAVYKKIWGYNFNNSFSDKDNSLRSLSDSELTLTTDHLKAYVSNAALGSVLRICNADYLHGSDGWGHSQIIVQKDSNGFTVFEGGLSAWPYCREKYYTWSEYVNTGWLGGTYKYIKYIKWPGAPAYSGKNGHEPGKPILLGMQDCYQSGCAISFRWNATENTTHYNLYIDQRNATGEYKRYESVLYAQSGLTRILSDGNYRAQIQSTNSNCWTDDNSTWLYTDGDWIYFSVVDYTPSKPYLLNMKSVYSENDVVTYEWQPTKNTTHYNLYIDQRNATGEYERYESVHYAASNLTRTYSVGSYRAQIQSTNSNYWTDDNSTWLYTDSDWVYFEVVIGCASGHSYSYKVTSTPTVSATGVITGTCSRCSGTTTVTLPKLNTTDYSYSVVNAATCTATGTGRYTWKTTTYGSFYFDVTLAKTAHNYTIKVTTPTCTEQGYTTHTCECGDSYNDTYVDALGHAWDNGTVTTQPTETTEGVKTFTCTRCGITRTETIPATGNKPCEGGADCPSGKFVDVNPKEWYHPYVDYAVTHGLFGGTSANTFEPETAMTRAMLVTVLWRYEGEPEAGENTFSDVPNGQWYTNAVAWAAENGIVGGVGNNRFDPNGEITREQMATILFRYAEKKGIDTSKRGSLNIFSDEKQLSAYAKDAVQWAVAEQIINGSDGKLLPQGNATRAQVATILMRFIENIVKK